MVKDDARARSNLLQSFAIAGTPATTSKPRRQELVAGSLPKSWLSGAGKANGVAASYSLLIRHQPY
jgi:hypothetical protein